MNFSRMQKEQDSIYYNIDIINGRTESQGIANDPRASFNETRDIPIIRDISNYKMAIMRFTINGLQDIPLFIPHIEPNQTNPNKTIYSVKMAYLHTNLTLYESSQNVIWSPEDPDFQPPNNPFTTQKMEYEYYYCNSYNHFITLVNNALSSAIADINAQVKVDDPSFTDLKTSFLVYEPSKKKFDFYILDDLKLKVFFNSNLYNLIGFYPHELDDDNEQPASISGSKIFFSGLINFAVSAIKCTPHIIIMSAFVFAASTARASESAEKSEMP